MDLAIPANSLPKVSVIIPARNEEANLERCLRSLVVQKGISFEIVVVNDASTDRTLAIAESFTRVRQCPYIALNQDLLDVRVMNAPEPLPVGWSGKVNALVAGEAVAQGEWLLFTDADTEHFEGSLAAAVVEAEQDHAEMLSYSPEQFLTGIRQQLLMPVIFGELALKYSPRRVSDPSLPDAAANGQYLLARAISHRSIGGFATVATQLLEDVALARCYKQHGLKIRFRLGRGLVRTRMYSSWEELCIGWTKNLVLLFPDARNLARKRIAEFSRLLLLLVIVPLWTVFYFTHIGLARDWFWTLFTGLFWFSSFVGFAGFYARVARAHFPFWPSLLSLFGLPSFAGLLRDSARAHQEGTVTWRGRAYQTAGVETHSAASNPK